MQSYPHILVLSSYAEDQMIYLETGEVETRPGGPALWIERAYQRMGVEHTIVTSGRTVEVKLELVQGEPLPGKVSTAGSAIVLNEDLSSDGILINTLDGFDLAQVLRLSGVILLDIAPYTRTGVYLDQRCNVDLPPVEVRKGIAVIKANHEEFPYLPKLWADEQKERRILIHTLGKDGLDLWVRGERTHFEAPQGKPKNLLGAGDTFGAAFLAHYLKGDRNAEAACRAALGEVECLFAEKNQESEESRRDL